MIIIGRAILAMELASWMTREKCVILWGFLVRFACYWDVRVVGIKEVNMSDSWALEDIFVLVCVCVCVCLREREKEREREFGGLRIENWSGDGFYSCFLGTGHRLKIAFRVHIYLNVNFIAHFSSQASFLKVYAFICGVWIRY